MPVREDNALHYASSFSRSPVGKPPRQALLASQKSRPIWDIPEKIEIFDKLKKLRHYFDGNS